MITETEMVMFNDAEKISFLIFRGTFKFSYHSQFQGINLFETSFLLYFIQIFLDNFIQKLFLFLFRFNS